MTQRLGMQCLLAEQAHALAGEVGLRQAAKRLGIQRDALKAAFGRWGLPALARRVGWQPSRFLADRAEAERAFQLAERLGSVNAAAAELGTTWPSLRKAFTRHGLGMPARNPEAVRQRAIDAAHRRRGGRPPLTWTRRYGAQPRRASRPGAVGWGAGPAGPTGRGLRGARCAGGGGAAHRKPRHEAQHAGVGDHQTRRPRPPPPPRPPAARPAAPGRSHQPHRPTAATPGSGTRLLMPADPHRPDQPDSEQRFYASICLDVPGLWPKAPLGYESFEHRSAGCSPVRNQPIYRGLGLLTHRQPCRPVPSGAG
jgi:hypothetical protein